MTTWLPDQTERPGIVTLAADRVPTGTAMSVLAAASVVIPLALVPGLRRAADAATPSGVGAPGT